MKCMSLIVHVAFIIHVAWYRHVMVHRIALCIGTSHDMGVSARYGSKLGFVFDGGLGTVGRRPTKSHICIHRNENMCRVIASKDRHPPSGERPVIFCHTHAQL